MTEKPHVSCPDCEAAPVDLSRRDFLRTVGVTVGGIAVATAAPSLLPALAQGTAKAKPIAKPESLVKTLHESLSPAQRELLCMAWDHPKRTTISANWAIVNTSIGELKPDQQEMVKGILRGLTTDEWYPRLQKQMQDDSAGLTNYHIALFGDPGTDKYEWVITGRHLTLRVDGNSDSNAAFGGPIFYGHAPKDTEDATHPGNVYWQQGVKANAVFAALDGKQRDIALLPTAPPENKVQLQGKDGSFPGIAVGELSHDQKKLVESVMRDLLSPYRPSDADEAMQTLKANGGLDKLHLSFYKNEDLGNDGVWDIWRLEGPAFVWHFRGAPHVHTWVNVAKDAKESHIRVA